MRLITLEEHYTSEKINERAAKMMRESEKDQNAQKKDGHTKEMFQRVTDLGLGRIEYMDRMGIDAQIISVVDKVPSMLEAEYAVPLCSALNEELAEKTLRFPKRFYPLASLSIAAPSEAAKELEYCVKKCHFVGGVISGHYENRSYDDPWYFPIFEKAQELDVPIYLHPCRVDQDIADKYYTGKWSKKVQLELSGFGIGWHYDVGMQVVKMILAGIFDQLPNLKIIIGHWGEVVAYYMYRLDEIDQKDTGLKEKVSEYFKRNIYVNPSGMMYPSQFRFCLDNFGEDHILWGEDYPYRRPENIRSMLEESDITEEQREKIAHGNAERILHIS